MPYFLCDTHKQAFDSWAKFTGHWNFGHKGKPKPQQEEVFSEVLPQGFESREKKTPPRTRTETPAKEPPLPEELPEDFIERVELSLRANEIPDRLTSQVVNKVKWHPDVRENPNAFSNMLTSILSTSVTGRKYIGKIGWIVSEVFGQPVQAIPPYFSGAMQAQPYFPYGYGFQPYPGLSYPPGYGSPQGYSPEIQTLQNRIKELELKLQTGGQGGTMTLFDDKGNPTAEVPYDSELVSTLKRKAEAETEAIKTKQLIEQLGGGGGTDRIQQLLKPLEDKVERAEKAAEAARKDLADEQLKRLEERITVVEEVAAGSEGKTALDYATEGASEMKSGIQEAAKDIKEGITHAGDKVAEVVTGVRKRRESSEKKSLGQVANLMQAEEDFLKAVRGKESA